MPDTTPIPSNFFDPFYWPIHVTALVLLAASIGSFLNVCIYRIPLGISTMWPPSHCYSCGQSIKWYDNIPLASYLILRGRCRRCGAPFSARYFLIELLTLALILGIALRLQYTLALIPAWIFTCLLIVGTFTDIDHWIIPDRITIGGTVAGLALAAIWPVGLAAGNPLAEGYWWDLPLKAQPFINSAIGAAAGFAILYGVGWIGTLIFRKEAMGFGDVKLFAMLGSFCGVTYLLHILVLSCLIGSVVGLLGMLRGRLARNQPVDPAVAPLTADAEYAVKLTTEHSLTVCERKAVQHAITKPGAVGAVRHHLPFGPSLAAGALIVYFCGPELTRIFNWFVLG